MYKCILVNDVLKLSATSRQFQRCREELGYVQVIAVLSLASQTCSVAHTKRQHQGDDGPLWRRKTTI